jgi:hypothetical protein
LVELGAPELPLDRRGGQTRSTSRSRRRSKSAGDAASPPSAATPATSWTRSVDVEDAFDERELALCLAA